jgi:hypothetical protein
MIGAVVGNPVLGFCLLLENGLTKFVLDAVIGSFLVYASGLVFHCTI